MALQGKEEGLLSGATETLFILHVYLICKHNASEFENTEEHNSKAYSSILHHLHTHNTDQLNILAYGI